MSKADETRMMILKKAFELIYQRGYQATSIDDIIATTKVTKGAFYYHFKNKQEMGLGLINDLLYPGLFNMMILPLEKSDDPIRDIFEMMERLLTNTLFFDVNYGCPAINLVEEMSPIDASFKKALSKLVNAWKAALVSAINSAKAMGKISAATTPEETAMIILSGYGGVRNLGKILGRSAYKSYLSGLKDYLSKL